MFPNRSVGRKRKATMKATKKASLFLTAIVTPIILGVTMVAGFGLVYFTMALAIIPAHIYSYLGPQGVSR